MIEASTAANPNTAIIVNVGHAFDANFGATAKALLAVWYPGQGFAPALASVLAGDREPGGRLAVTLAREETDYPGYALAPDTEGALVYSDGRDLGYRGLIARGCRALYPFGFGRGYVKFKWSDAASDGATVTLTVANESARAGSDVVQLYTDSPHRILVGFAKVHLAPFASTAVSITIDPIAMRSVSNAPSGNRAAIHVGRSAEDILFSTE